MKNSVPFTSICISLYFLLLFLLSTSVCHTANKHSKGQVCTFREDVGTGTPPKYKKSRKPMNVLVSEWRQGRAIVPLLRPGDLMELKHTEGTHWMIYVGGPKLEYIHTSYRHQSSLNWTSVQKASLLTSCQRWMIRKNNGLDAKHEHYSPAQVVQRAEDLVGCTRIPFAYSHNNCQHFVNSVRYDIWQSNIADQRNSCERNTKPWRQVVERKFPAIQIDKTPLYKLSKTGKSGKQVVLEIKFYGSLPEDIHSAYRPLVKLIRRRRSRNGTLKSVKGEFDPSKITNKAIGQLLEFLKQRTEKYHAKNLKDLEQEKKTVVLKALVLREWNSLVKKLYSKVLSTSPEEADDPINASDGGAIECYRDWDLDYMDKLLDKLIGHYVKNRHARQYLTSFRHMIQYKII